MIQLKRDFNFMGARRIAAIFSILLLLLSIGSLAINGLKLGLDFTGGSLVEVTYEQPVELETIRNALRANDYGDAVVQTFGSANDILIRLGQAHDPQLGQKILEILQQDADSTVTLRRNEFVGSQVGEELREQGGLGLLVALIMVMIYLAFRFQYKFSVGAVLALAHDVIIVLGFFSLLQIEFDLTVLAALLAVIGYSLNDTIVVYDRIRENFRILRVSESLGVLNASLNETLSRTLVTSLTTMLVLVVLAFFGGEMIYGFSIALLTGVVIGTYSSVYVAGNILLLLNVSREDLIPPPPKEDEEEELVP
ncbi:protein translocase subunit SecF [Nitrincola iocasae]|jgi:preprotein translocase subunit SecF|uniref:Protein-export membrane protein SecF n=1 Tax=Nitrincola iocasae TaxID=2614693 RepID=A0A5J6LH38_9GAMM|nr:protein translocase subunit SecF [Nitrincola iocasae]QEW07798.1 protein translocase subunit SecF [Nitrincola iocasae]